MSSKFIGIKIPISHTIRNLPKRDLSFPNDRPSGGGNFWVGGINHYGPTPEDNDPTLPDWMKRKMERIKKEQEE